MLELADRIALTKVNSSALAKISQLVYVVILQMKHVDKAAAKLKVSVRLTCPKNPSTFKVNTTCVHLIQKYAALLVS